MPDGDPSPPVQRPSSEPSAVGGRLKRLLAVSGVVLLVGLGGYLTGRLQASGRIDRVEEAAQALRGAQTELEDRLEQSERDVLALEARRRLHLALLALDNRNFGIAQKQLEVGGELLERARPEDLGEVADAMRNYDLVAVEDSSEHRALIIGWAARVDQAVPPRQAPRAP